MHRVRLCRYGGATQTIRLFERALDERRFGWFGCARHGLHVDDAEAFACQRCALRPSDDSSDAMSFSDDRGDLTTGWGHAGGESWIHTRWLDPYGRLHRDDADQPALEAEDLRMWATHGRLRRPAGGPSILAGDDHWAFTNAVGYLHRDKGKPAISWDGTFQHVVNGVLTRPNGAAIYGSSHPEYWLDGRPTTLAELWACYLEPYGITKDNAGAHRYLADALGRSRDPADAFPDVDPLTVSVALAMYRS